MLLGRIGHKPCFVDSPGVNRYAGLFAGQSPFLNGSFTLSTAWTTGPGVEKNLLPRPGNASFLIEFAEFLYHELHILAALILPNTRFQEGVVCPWLGKIKAKEVTACNSTEPLDETRDKLAGVLTRIETLLFCPLPVSQRATVTQTQAYCRS